MEWVNSSDLPVGNFSWRRFVAQLKKNPGQWAKANGKYQRANAYTLGTRYPDITFRLSPSTLDDKGRPWCEVYGCYEGE